MGNGLSWSIECSCTFFEGWCVAGSEEYDFSTVEVLLWDVLSNTFQDIDP